MDHLSVSATIVINENVLNFSKINFRSFSKYVGKLK